MRNYPDADELSELEDLKAEPWQSDLLKLNPSYCCWGNFEDYMSDDKGGWSSRQELESFSERWGLDDLNELVNFYFSLYRKNHECPHCKGSGLNPATQDIADTFYDFDHTGRKWSDKITQDEVEALVKEGRLFDYMPDKKWYRFDQNKNHWLLLDRSGENQEWAECERPEMPTAEVVNKGNMPGARGYGSHDGINRMILIHTRANRLGVYGHCEHCESGYIYDENKCRVALQLWWLHPRKGCTRGVYIKNIEKTELPEVFAYLRAAADRNANRFSKIPNITHP